MPHPRGSPLVRAGLRGFLDLGRFDVIVVIALVLLAFGLRFASPIFPDFLSGKGTITALKLRPEGPLTFVPEVVSVRGLSSDFKTARARATATGRQISLPGPTDDQASNGVYPIVTVPVKMKVKKGQELAINTASNTAEYCSDGTPGQLLFDPALAKGSSTFRTNDGVDGCLMLVQAKIRH